jgi:excisionase family DNA binding protein
MAAEPLTVSPDTVYDLFKRGELPGRKVGRKWLTTRNALLRWIESSSENNTLARVIEREDRQAITTALKSGKVQIKKR